VWIPIEIDPWVVGLMCILLGLLAYQQFRIHSIQQLSQKREELFRIVALNAADMIAVVDAKGRRLYNSPAYQKVLGYSSAELEGTSSFEQIHPDDRYKVLEAAREARNTGVGKSLQYRMKHKNGQWRVLESTASTIRNANGDVEKLVIVNRDITERKLAEEQLEHNSFHDGLTGLPNRRLFLDRLEHSFARARRNTEYHYAVLFVDVDGFKVFNDTMGAAAGDRVIVELSRRLASCLRHDDTVARPRGRLPVSDAVLSRLGGDEFTVLLETITDPSDALRVANRILAAVAKPFSVEGQGVAATASVGVSLSMTLPDRAEDLLRDAEIAMRRAKALGGSRCELYDTGMHSRAEDRLKLEKDLRAAFDRNEFRVYYQPIVQLETKRIIGFEALVRWHHPEQGVISPYKFIEAAEDMGLLVSIGQWVIWQACKQVCAWQSRYQQAGTLSLTLNLSDKQFAHKNLVSDVRAAVQETGIVPDSVVLEITESVAMADAKLTANLMSQLKHLGVRISIDDFGTGSLSLSWLRRFPIDVLKIDRSLVSNITTDRANHDIVQLIITVAGSLSRKVVAEGIETSTHLERVKALGCEFGQGYFFSQPVEAEKAEELLRQQTARPRSIGAGGKA
jgi:diguanylate cyclase (GGDEF)-like protein/PAS domain S-box-containing protein